MPVFFNGAVMFTHSINASYSLAKFNFQETARPRFQQPEPQIGQMNKGLSAPPQKILDVHVFNQLENTLNNDGISIQGLNAEDYTPEKVADNILASIRQAYGRFQQANPSADDSEFFAAVEQGLEKGFKESREILQGLGVLHGQIADDIDKTHDLAKQGLAAMQSQAGSSLESALAFHSLERQASRSAEIEITTREGDVVTVNFSHNISSSRSALQMQQEDVSLTAYQERFSQSSGFSIAVEGDLNNEEKKSLKKLMRKMQRVSDAFFNGKGKAALKHAQKLGFNHDQIAGLSMDLNMQHSVKAVAAYQQTSLPKHTVDPDRLAGARDFLNDAKHVLADARDSLHRLAEPQNSFTRLFTEIARFSVQESGQMETADDQEVLSSLISSMSQSVFSGDLAHEVD